MATTGPTVLSHIRAMITGYEEEPDESVGQGETPATEKKE
jgi:hypothetical protein